MDQETAIKALLEKLKPTARHSSGWCEGHYCAVCGNRLDYGDMHKAYIDLYCKNDPIKGHAPDCAYAFLIPVFK